MKKQLILALSILVTAAGASASAPRSEGTNATQIKDSKATSACVSLFERQRVCTDLFIPALVDLRIRLDIPEGIAAEAADAGRVALIRQALAEWKLDSRDDSILETCEAIAATEPRAFERAAAACLPLAGCAAFVQCVLPTIEQSLTSPER